MAFSSGPHPCSTVGHRLLHQVMWCRSLAAKVKVVLLQGLLMHSIEMDVIFTPALSEVSSVSDTAHSKEETGCRGPAATENA